MTAEVSSDGSAYLDLGDPFTNWLGGGSSVRRHSVQADLAALPRSLPRVWRNRNGAWALPLSPEPSYSAILLFIWALNNSATHCRRPEHFVWPHPLPACNCCVPQWQLLLYSPYWPSPLPDCSRCCVGPAAELGEVSVMSMYRCGVCPCLCVHWLDFIEHSFKLFTEHTVGLGISCNLLILIITTV